LIIQSSLFEFLKKFSSSSKIESIIGYKFNNNSYLNIALTHRSIQPDVKLNYERLEFLGDAIIDQIISHWLYKKYPNADEGILTQKRSSLVNKDFLAMVGNKLNLLKFINRAPNINFENEKVNSNVISDIYEAIVGAIFMDGGIKPAKTFILRTLCIHEDKAEINLNYKGQLIEYCHSKNANTPLFETIKTIGPEHEKVFKVKVTIDDNSFYFGMGDTKKKAEQNAAMEAIRYIIK
tara:strand:+ start:2128 stop:2835 length:708 start_codon:yes stop_codon:yes gene_type:complete